MNDRFHPVSCDCAGCPFKNADRLCMSPGGKHPDTCPTRHQADALARAQQEYEKPDICAFAHAASVQEGEGYAGREHGYAKVMPLKPRILEIAEFARRMNYRRLGLIFCAGLA